MDMNEVLRFCPSYGYIKSKSLSIRHPIHPSPVPPQSIVGHKEHELPTSDKPLHSSSFLAPSSSSSSEIRVPDGNDLEMGDMLCIYRLEAKSYHPEEAASFDKLMYRFGVARGCFLVLVKEKETRHQEGDKEDTREAEEPKGGEKEDEIIGFINGTSYSGDEMPLDIMDYRHDEAGDSLCIHSVVIHPSHQRQGLARAFLQCYCLLTKHIYPSLKQHVLISRPKLVDLYKQVGFEDMGVSPITHGPDPWIYMKRNCRDEMVAG